MPNCLEIGWTAASGARGDTGARARAVATHGERFRAGQFARMSNFLTIPALRWNSCLFSASSAAVSVLTSGSRPTSLSFCCTAGTLAALAMVAWSFARTSGESLLEP